MKYKVVALTRGATFSKGRPMRCHSATRLVVSIAFALLTAATSHSALAADEWDTPAITDNTATSTRNELQRGEWQRHDLEAVAATADEDWFVAPTVSFRTYQVFVSEVTGDTPIDNADFLTLWDATGAQLLLTAGAGATGKVIRWNSDAGTSFRVRVKGSTNSTSNAKYSILFVETTMYCPRYNNAGTQSSVLILQNVTNGTCNVFVGFEAENGNFINGTSVPVPGAGTLVLPASSVAGVQGTKGSVQIMNTSCSPSAFKGKMVALEPSTGFSFDTLCERR